MQKKRSRIRPMREEIAAVQTSRQPVLGMQGLPGVQRNQLAEFYADLQAARTAYSNGRYYEAERNLASLVEDKPGLDNLPGETEQMQGALLTATMASLMGRIRRRQQNIQPAEELLALAEQTYDRWFPQLAEPSNQVLGDYGVTLFLRGRKAEALPNLTKGVAYQDTCPDTYFYLGQLCQEQGELAKAKRLFEQTRDLLPESYEVHAALAHTLESLGEKADAARAFQQAAILVYDDYASLAADYINHALRLDPGSAEVLITKAHILRLEGDFDKAKQLFQSVLAANANNAEAWHGFAMVMGSQGQLEEALEAINQALVIDPENNFFLIQRAIIRRNMEDYDDALAELQQCIKTDPQFPEAFMELGETLRILGKYEEALEALEIALAIAPEYAWAMGTKGQVLIEMERYHAAQLVLQAALNMDPSMGWAYSELGIALSALGEEQQALAAFEKALEISPDLIEPLLYQAQLLRGAGKSDQALPLIEQALQKLPEDIWVLTEKALTLAELDRIDDALAVLEHASALDPDNLYLRQLGVDILHNAGKYERALSALERLLELESDEDTGTDQKAQLHFQRAQIFSSAGDYDSALAALEEVVDLDVRWFEAWFNLAEIAQWLGYPAKAVVAYDRALALKPGDLDCLRGQGYALLGLFRNNEAVVVFKEAAAQHPEELLLLTDLALAYKYAGDYAEALRQLDRGLAVDPNNLPALGTKGDVLCEIGEYEKAVEVLNHALEIDHADAYIYGTKGWALENLGPDRAQEALDAYQAALELAPPFPNDLWARKGIANAKRLLGEVNEALAAYRMIIEDVEKAEVEINVNFLPLVGWCHYQVALYGSDSEHFDLAVRYYMDTLSLNSESLATQFDLALTLLCKSRRRRALSEYCRCLERVQEQHLLRQRGLLHVAVDDLEEALAALPQLAQRIEVQFVRRRLHQALAQARETGPQLVVQKEEIF